MAVEWTMAAAGAPTAAVDRECRISVVARDYEKSLGWSTEPEGGALYLRGDQATILGMTIPLAVEVLRILKGRGHFPPVLEVPGTAPRGVLIAKLHPAMAHQTWCLRPFVLALERGERVALPPTALPTGLVRWVQNPLAMPKLPPLEAVVSACRLALETTRPTPQ
jgi:hypothetical protein